MLDTLLALACSTISVACLYLSWQKHFPNWPWLMPAGWLAALLAGVLWVGSSGTEFGVAYLLLVIPLMAWLAVLYNLEIKRKKQRLAENVNFVVPNTRTILRHFVLFLMALPLSAVAATYASVALLSLLPGSLVNIMVSAVLLVPLAWGLAAYWVCADPKPLRPTLWIAAGGLLGAALVHF